MLSGISLLGYAEYLLGNFERARSICEAKQHFWSAQMCLSVYEKLGRHDAAAAMLAKVRSRFGDSGAYGYTEVYAQWGDIASALDWLEKAYRLRDDDLLHLRSDPFMDPLRKEPRPCDGAGIEVSELSGGAVPTRFLRFLGRSFQCSLCRKLRVLLEWPELAAC